MRTKNLLLLGLSALLYVPVAALADGDISENSAGVITGNAALLFGPFYSFLVSGAVLMGVGLVMWAILDTFKKNNNPHHHHQVKWTGIGLKIIGGSMLIAISAFCNEGTQTLFGANMYISSITGHPPGALSQCDAAASGEGNTNQNAVLCVMRNISSNFTPVMNEAILTALTISGIIIIMIAIRKMATFHEPQNNRSTWANIVALFVIGFCFTCSTYFLDMLQSTFGLAQGFMTTQGQNYAGSGNIPEIFRYTAGSGDVISAYSALISNIFYIFTTVGLIAITRGGMILYTRFSDQPNNGATVARGLMHIIAGMFLFNGKWSMCVLISSLIGKGLGFCDS